MELLISMAIMGILLAALAAALNASMVNYQENEKLFKNINTARQALTRMTNEIRTAGWRNPSGQLLSVDPSAPLNQCSLYNEAGENIIYDFRSAEKKLYLIKNSVEYLLCDNVASATFNKTPTNNGFDTKSVQIKLTIQNGDYQQTLVAAAVVRKVLNR